MTTLCRSYTVGCLTPLQRPPVDNVGVAQVSLMAVETCGTGAKAHRIRRDLGLPGCDLREGWMKKIEDLMPKNVKNSGCLGVDLDLFCTLI